MIPLFVVTGISGAGKSTTSKELGKIMKDFSVFDMDLIVNNKDYLTASDNWLRIAYSNARCGRGTILFGHVPHPYNLEACKHFYLFNPIYYLHLYCNDEVRIQRLRARSWTEKMIQDHIKIEKEALKKAQTNNPKIPIVDTSKTPVTEVAENIKKWVLSKKINIDF